MISVGLYVVWKRTYVRYCSDSSAEIERLLAAASETSTGTRGMSHSGRLLPIKNLVSARISVTGNGNSAP
jgi:hypothetical protein